MAKRKRLTPAQPDYLEARQVAPVTRSALPIANVAGDAATVAALDEVSEVLRNARAEGLLIQKIPLEKIASNYLMRDRLFAEEDELTVLINSLREHGQRTPIEVCALENETYGLISGGRRMMALRRLHIETGDPQFGTVLAIQRMPANSANAYVAMVEENEIRVGLSYYERARITLRSVDADVFSSTQEALQHLFAAASRAKRSKIKSFVRLVKDLDDVLAFPVAIGERLGLAVSKALEERPELGEILYSQLAEKTSQTPEEEAVILYAITQQNQTRAKPAKKTLNFKAKEITSGVFLEATEKNAGVKKLTLSGPRVTAKLQQQLEEWLKRSE